jgi:hypothetical protein
MPDILPRKLCIAFTILRNKPIRVGDAKVRAITLSDMWPALDNSWWVDGLHAMHGGLV